MSRYIFQETAVDGAGNVITSATVNVYEAGGVVAANVYAASSGGSAVASVTTDSTNGTFSFYADDGDYVTTQKFKIVISKTNYISLTVDDIKIFPASSSEIELENVSGKHLSDLFDGGYDVPIKPQYIFGGGTNTVGHTVPNVADDTFALIAATQTLTNKTLTTPTLNSPVINTPTGDVVTKTGTQTLTNKTLTTPTIADLTNVTHDHTDASEGGAFTKPAISVHKGGTNQTGVVTNTWTPVTFDTEVFDTNGDFASNTFTPTVAGKYLLSATAGITVGADGKFCRLAIYKNGAVIHQGFLSVAGSNAANGASISAVVDANGSSDYFDIYLYQDTTSDKIIDGGATVTWFTGCKID